MFAVYIDDLITHLKNSGYGIYVGQIFTGCALYANDIALLSASCYALQNLVNICKLNGDALDVKFNSLKSQLITFGSDNPNRYAVLFLEKKRLIVLRLLHYKYSSEYLLCGWPRLEQT